MSDNEFQWDDRKAADNYLKHGVGFEMARGAFSDPFALEWLDDRRDYGEERYCLIGMSEGRLLFVVYTPRGDTIRIISARGAEPHERRKYHEHDA